MLIQFSVSSSEDALISYGKTCDKIRWVPHMLQMLFLTIAGSNID